MGKFTLGTHLNKIPYSVWQELCDHLEASNGWEILAEDIGFSTVQIQVCAKNPRPGDKVLKQYSFKNPTIREIIYKLEDLRLIGCADVLKKHAGVCDADTPGSNKPKKLNSAIEVYKRPYPDSSDEDDSQNTDDLPLPVTIKTVTQKKTPNFENRYQDFEIRNLSEGGDFYPSQPVLPNHGPWRQQNEVPSIAANSVPPHMHMLTQDISQLSLHSNSLYEQGTMSSPSKRLTGSYPPPPYNTGSYFRNSRLASGGQSEEIRFQLESSVQTYSYNDVKKATYGFDEEYVTRKSVFGQVYEAKLDDLQYDVFKFHSKLKISNTSQLQKLEREVKYILRLDHPNILQLNSYSCEEHEICLLYKHMETKAFSLDERLSKSMDFSPLSDLKRCEILLNVADALCYLHSNNGQNTFVHGAVNSASIMLDDKLIPKLCDVGLGNLASAGYTYNEHSLLTKEEMKQIMSTVAAYIPPEFSSNCEMSTKGDVFAFGIVILECCTGEQAKDEKREGGKDLKTYIEQSSGLESLLSTEDDIYNISSLHQRHCDKSLVNKWNNKYWHKLFQIGVDCIADSKDKRPEMAQVYTQIRDLVVSYTAESGQSGNQSNDQQRYFTPNPTQRLQPVEHLCRDDVARTRHQAMWNSPPQQYMMQNANPLPYNYPDASNLNPVYAGTSMLQQPMSQPPCYIHSTRPPAYIEPYSLNVMPTANSGYQFQNNSPSTTINHQTNLRIHPQYNFVADWQPQLQSVTQGQGCEFAVHSMDGSVMESIDSRCLSSSNAPAEVDEQDMMLTEGGCSAEVDDNIRVTVTDWVEQDVFSKRLPSFLGSLSSNDSGQTEESSTSEVLSNAVDADESSKIRNKPWPFGEFTESDNDHSHEHSRTSSRNNSMLLNTRDIRLCDKYSDTKCYSDPGPTLNHDAIKINLTGGGRVARHTLSGPQTQSISINSEPIYGSANFS